MDRGLYALYTKLREAGSASDFPYLMGNEMHKVGMATYAKVETTWQKWCKIEDQIRDFKENYRIATSETEDLEEVKPGQHAPEGSFDESRTNYKVKKYEKVFSIPWEYVVNDDIGAIKQQPQRFYRAAARTLAKFAVGLLVGRAASTVVTAALAEGTLGSAIQEFKTRTDSRTNAPLGITPKYLIVPPALEITAKRLLKSVDLIAIALSAGSPSVQGGYNAVNAQETGLELCVEPFLTDADDWYLAAAPADVPGIEIGFLNGRREPKTMVKAANIVGQEDPMDGGDFETGSIEYKIRHIFGGAMIDANAILKVEVSG